jgi:hypothetical protein
MRFYLRAFGGPQLAVDEGRQLLNEGPTNGVSQHGLTTYS